jgi:hypothetical protein
MESSMGSVSSSLNPGVSNLLQTLTNVNSPILNSQTAISAIESAPASDIVQLSAEATQLEGVDALFGISTPSTSNTTSVDTLFGIPTSSSTSTTNPILQAMQNAGATISSSDQAASQETATQAELEQGLFGTGTNNNAGSLLNLIG